MPVRVACPHCLTPCLLAEQHLGVPVKCGQCGKAFAARPAPPPAAPRLEVGCATSPGRVRRRNEDSFLAQHLTWSSGGERRELALVVVADGMGGNAAGDRASGLAVRALGDALRHLFDEVRRQPFQEANVPALTGTLDAALKDANDAVYQAAQADAACKGMGATAAVVVACAGVALVGHVGDCRVYHQRAGKLAQVTRDQTLVARMVELGKLTAKEAQHHPARNEVAQALGKQFDLEPAHHALKLAAGDWLLAACDGLHAHLDDRGLEAEMAKAGPSAAALAQRLVDLANQRGGSDNCTVVAVRCW